MTRFGKHLERSARDLVEEAVAGALADAEVEASSVQAAYVGNAVSGLMNGQESIRGQVVLRRTGLLGVPIVNVENACASSSTALHLGWQAVAGGMYECVAVVGYEKLYDEDKAKSFRAFNVLVGTLAKAAASSWTCTPRSRPIRHTRRSQPMQKHWPWYQSRTTTTGL
jgi:acetyl-CoA acetyltransferase